MHVFIFVYHGLYHLSSFIAEYTVITELTLIGHLKKWNMVPIGVGALISCNLIQSCYRKTRSWFVNQLLDPGGQRRSQGSCDPLECQHTGIKERVKGKHEAFQAGRIQTHHFKIQVPFRLRLNFCQMVKTDGYTLWGHLSVDAWLVFSRWHWVIVSLSSITTLNPHKWRWPLPCVMLCVWQTSWVCPFC